MSVEMVIVEIRPGMLVRMRAGDVHKVAGNVVQQTNKAAAPAAAKKRTKKADAAAETEPDTDAEVPE